LPPTTTTTTTAAPTTTTTTTTEAFTSVVYPAYVAPRSQNCYLDTNTDNLPNSGGIGTSLQRIWFSTDETLGSSGPTLNTDIQFNINWSYLGGISAPPGAFLNICIQSTSAEIVGILACDCNNWCDISIQPWNIPSVCMVSGSKCGYIDIEVDTDATGYFDPTLGATYQFAIASSPSATIFQTLPNRITEGTCFGWNSGITTEGVSGRFGVIAI
jgi:hypothetical protein